MRLWCIVKNIHAGYNENPKLEKHLKIFAQKPVLYLSILTNMDNQKNGSGAIYCFHYLLPMTHSADNYKEHIHSHTLEITVYISGKGTVNEEFSVNERYAGDVLKRYENAYFNELPEFGRDASIENVGEVFFRILTDVLAQADVDLLRLEIGENPLRQYVISTYM